MPLRRNVSRSRDDLFQRDKTCHVAPSFEESGRMKDSIDLDATREVAFAAVNTAFASLGRICMGLDSRFRVRHASQRVEMLLGPGAATQIVGQPVESVLGSELFGSDG